MLGLACARAPLSIALALLWLISSVLQAAVARGVNDLRIEEIIVVRHQPQPPPLATAPSSTGSAVAAMLCPQPLPFHSAAGSSHAANNSLP